MQKADFNLDGVTVKCYSSPSQREREEEVISLVSFLKVEG